MTRRLVGLLPALLVLAVVIVAWEVYVDSGAGNAFVLPAPHSVFAAVTHNGAYLWSNFTTTAAEVGIGITLSLLLGLALAVIIHFSSALRQALYPLAVGSQAVPIVVIAPLLVFWWGFGIVPKLVIIVLICFFPVLVTTVDALAAVDPDQLKLLRTMDATRWQSFRFAEAPAALPAALSGARISLAVAVIGAFIAESTAGSSSGLGHEIVTDLTALATARAYAAALILGLFAVLCFNLLGVLERRLAPWAQR